MNLLAITGGGPYGIIDTYYLGYCRVIYRGEIDEDFPNAYPINEITNIVNSLNKAYQRGCIESDQADWEFYLDSTG